MTVNYVQGATARQELCSLPDIVILMRRVRPYQPSLEPKLQRQIGQQLRAMYDEIIEEVPKHHRELLQRFDTDQTRQRATAQKAPRR